METFAILEDKSTSSKAFTVIEPAAFTVRARLPRSICARTSLPTSKVISRPPPAAAYEPPARVTPTPFKSVSLVSDSASTRMSPPASTLAALSSSDRISAWDVLATFTVRRLTLIATAVPLTAVAVPTMVLPPKSVISVSEFDSTVIEPAAFIELLLEIASTRE